MGERTSVESLLERLRASAIEAAGQAQVAVGCLQSLGLGSLRAAELLDEIRAGASGGSSEDLRSLLADIETVVVDRERRLAAVAALAAEAQAHGLY